MTLTGMHILEISELRLLHKRRKIMKENMYSAHRTDNGEITSGYYFARPSDPTGPKDFIVTAGSAKWIEIDPATLKPMPTKHAVSQE